jgi:outer membrane protein assembly factor BamD
MLNNDDMNEKYKAAEEYYNNGEYRRANRLLEQLVPSFRGKPQAERLVFFFADSYFQTKSYYLASYQFESFIKSFPKSQKIEEASFLAAKSHYMMSPIYSLDQEETVTAI